MRILYLNINCVSFAFPCWNLPVSTEWWEKLFSKDWENNQKSQSATFLLWFLGKMDYKNIVMQGKNSPRPQHYGCGTRISLGAENGGSKASRKLSLRRSGGKSWAPFCNIPSPSSSSCSSAESKGGVHVSHWIPQWEGLRKESEWETLWTQHNCMRGNTDQTKPGLIAVRLGLWAKQNLLCPLIPLLTREEQNSTCLCHLWELKSTWGSRQGEGSPMVHVPCPDIFQDQEKDNVIVNEMNYYLIPVAVLNSTELQAYTQWGPFSTQHESLAQFLCSPVSRFSFPFLWLSSCRWVMDRLQCTNIRVQG